MKLNENTYIIGEKVVLVPYKQTHVLRYHEWMKSPELQESTASEPLSLEEEYEMQQTWLNSEDKLTFIVLDRILYEKNPDDETAAMIGDTNIFFHKNDADQLIGETEIMVAEKMARGGGRGWEAMLLMMHYACQNLAVAMLEAKIGLTNEPSLKLFQKFGFKEASRSMAFKEATLLKEVDSEFLTWLSGETSNALILEKKPD